jgi:ferritin
MDIIKINVPAFIRLIELAREEVKNDADLHDLAEIVTKISQEEVVTMDHYQTIVKYMKTQGTTDELAQIRKLGGMK